MRKAYCNEPDEQETVPGGKFAGAAIETNSAADFRY